jgi:hypothetical protein
VVEPHHCKQQQGSSCRLRVDRSIDFTYTHARTIPRIQIPTQVVSPPRLPPSSLSLGGSTTPQAQHKPHCSKAPPQRRRHAHTFPRQKAKGQRPPSVVCAARWAAFFKMPVTSRSSMLPTAATGWWAGCRPRPRPSLGLEEERGGLASSSSKAGREAGREEGQSRGCAAHSKFSQPAQAAANPVTGAICPSRVLFGRQSG